MDQGLQTTCGVEPQADVIVKGRERGEGGRSFAG